MSFYEWGKVVSCSAYMCIQLKESEINWKSLIDVRTWVWSTGDFSAIE